MNIKECRRSKKLTQSDLANALGVERTTVSMWENNCSRPSIDTLKQIAKILNCSLDELIA